MSFPLTETDFPAVSQILEQMGRAKQLNLGLQLSIATAEGQSDLAFGESEPGLPLTAHMRLPWMSAAKPITAVLIGQLVESGQCEWETPVCELVPGFDHPTHNTITLKHLLTHTSGLQQAALNFQVSQTAELITQINALEQKSSPGEIAAYVPQVTWVLLMGVIEALTGQQFGEVVLERVLSPCQMTQTTCQGPLSPEVKSQFSKLYERVKAQRVESDWNGRIESPVPNPGSSFAGPASDLCRFYAQLMAIGAGKQSPLALSQRTLTEMTLRHRKGMHDETFQHTVDYGMGVIINSREYGPETVPYGYGPQASLTSYGHGGSQSSIAFVDPERQISLVMISNGRPGEGHHQRLFRKLLEGIEA